MANHVVWFDIPALEIERAIRFYANVLNISVKKENPELPMGVFEHQDGMVSGCIFQGKEFTPSAGGPLLYFNTEDRLQEAADLVVPNGGKLLEAPRSIGPWGYRALALDSEGNRIALFSSTL